jgi:hypothetical protein
MKFGELGIRVFCLYDINDLCIFPEYIKANNMLMMMRGLFNCALANNRLVRRSNYPIAQNVAICVP